MKKDILHEKPAVKSFKELVEWAADAYKTRCAFSSRPNPAKDEVIKKSYIELRDDVRALGSEMLARGYRGRHIVIIGKLSYEWALVYFAALSIGAVLVPLDRDWSKEELSDTAKSADIDFLFCDEDISDKGEYIMTECGLSDMMLLSENDGKRSISSLILSGREHFALNSEPYFSLSNDTSRLALLVFTSGTTGKGKGVMLSENAIISDIASIVPYIDFSEKTVGVLPPHHTYGSSVMLAGHVMIGAEVYISAGLRYIVKELKSEKPGHLVLVPLYLETFYRKIMANVKEQGKEGLLKFMRGLSNILRKLGIDLRKKLFRSVREAFGGELRTIISGGAPINGEIIDFFESIGIQTLNGYGITECAPIIAVNHSKNTVRGSVGNVSDIDEVIIDEPNEAGEGEILVRGCNVMLGYYKQPEATAEAITPEGFFRTGDYGKLREDGILYITGRKKNLIILSNGKNVYPEEIENELVAAPGVIDIVVYEGKSKRGTGHNAIVAEIYPDKEFMEKNKISDIKAYLQTYVDEYNKNAVVYKKIDILRVRDDEFPKNTLRKIMRFKIDTTIE